MSCMKKGIWLSLGALLLIGVIVFAIWYINEEGKMRTGSKSSFIPYNSAFVVSVDAQPVLKPEVRKVLGNDLEFFRRRLLGRVTDTLRTQGYVMSYPYVIAMRVEGKSDVSFLYVMDNKDVLSRNEVAHFLNQVFADGKEKVRKYDKHKIYTLQHKKEVVYFAVCGGITLISDSELYVEDGLKQFDLEAVKGESKAQYKNLDKYFSAGANIHLFLNTAAFAEVLPLYIQTKKIFSHLDITHLFKWGALDGEFSETGICLNGFMHCGGGKSYMQTLEKQQPRSVGIDAVVPSRLMSLGMLNLSNPAAYFSALEAYRYSTGTKEKVYDRKKQYIKMFGREREEELQQLLQGEFAMVGLGYNEATREKDGLVIAALKSGSLGKIVLEKMLKAYAHFDGKTTEEYTYQYNIDREKAFTYFRLPVDDIVAVYWGNLFEEIKSRYVLIEDNYLVFGSSEKAMKGFIQDYVHGSVVRDAEWYKQLKKKLAGKYNLAYFARTADVLPFYKTLVTDEVQHFISTHMEKLSVFPALAMQWSNEGEMLYSTFLLSTEDIQEDVRPHVLWQTKLDGKVSMKPVPVTNHATGERELFVQDDHNTVYLLNDAGRILWKMPLDGRINSEVYQVDLFKNGKLQYLFSTSAKMYLIDRNGNAAGRFPLSFRAECKQGISVYDYDNNKNYRIFAPCSDRKVYLYGLDGNMIKGWEPQKTDKPIVTKVQHFRLEGKDYLVFADRYRLYVLDRKGKERVRISSVFDLPEQMDIYLIRKNKQPYLIFAGRDGNIQLVNFSGQIKGFKVEGLSEHFRMNVADVNRDGTEECIFVDKDRLFVVDLEGRVVIEKKLDVAGLDYPYIYRFSNVDIRIGVTDAFLHQMLLLDAQGNISKGFPIPGDSPFSIVFFGQEGFYLFAGADDGSVIKYKVQR